MGSPAWPAHLKCKRKILMTSQTPASASGRGPVHRAEGSAPGVRLLINQRLGLSFLCSLHGKGLWGGRAGAFTVFPPSEAMAKITFPSQNVEGGTVCPAPLGPRSPLCSHQVCHPRACVRILCRGGSESRPEHRDREKAEGKHRVLPKLAALEAARTSHLEWFWPQCTSRLWDRLRFVLSQKTREPGGVAGGVIPEAHHERREACHAAWKTSAGGQSHRVPSHLPRRVPLHVLIGCCCSRETLFITNNLKLGSLDGSVHGASVLSSGHDLTVRFVSSSPTSVSLLPVQSLLGILCPSLSAPPHPSSPSQKQIKHLKKSSEIKNKCAQLCACTALMSFTNSS